MEPKTPSSPLPGKRLLAFASLFFIVLGARLWLIHAYGSALPFWDQWDGEAAFLLKPWLTGQWGWAQLVAPHVEHRIILSRLLALGLFILNRQWDAELEMSVNAILYALLAVGIAAVIWRKAERREAIFMVFIVMLAFSLPFPWENVLGGFQGCFFMLLASSLLMIWGLTLHRAYSLCWWMGVASGGLACCSMASGFLAAIAILGGMLIRRMRVRDLALKQTFPNVAICLSVTILGLLTKPPTAGGGVMKSASAVAFVRALGCAMAWPFKTMPWLALCMYLPFFLLLSAYLLRTRFSGAVQRRCELLLAVGVWAILQSLAIAYARGGISEIPASRYMDILATGGLVNALAAMTLFTHPWTTAACRQLAAGVFLGWTLVSIIGLVLLTNLDFTIDLPAKKRLADRQEENVRAFVATDDMGYLANKLPLEIPYSVPERLAELLRDPVIRQFLPAVVRRPLHVEKAGGDANVFVPNGFYPTTQNESYRKTWGSYSSEGNAARGWMESKPIHRDFPYLEIQVAGYLGEANHTLEIEDVSTGRRSEIHPAKVARERWRSEYVAVSNGSTVIRAVDNDPAYWFAFREPVELGRWSYYSGFLIRKGESLFFVGILLSATLILGGWMHDLGGELQTKNNTDQE